MTHVCERIICQIFLNGYLDRKYIDIRVENEFFDANTEITGISFFANKSQNTYSSSYDVIKWLSDFI